MKREGWKLPGWTKAPAVHLHRLDRGKDKKTNKDKKTF